MLLRSHSNEQFWIHVLQAFIFLLLWNKILLNWKISRRHQEEAKNRFSRKRRSSKQQRWWYSFVHICFVFFLPYYATQNWNGRLCVSTLKASNCHQSQCVTSYSPVIKLISYIRCCCFLLNQVGSLNLI